jgi:hypothetical protein
MTTQPSPFTPPPVADRRAPERRARGDRHVERDEALRVAAAAGIAVCGGLSVLFLFFAAIGAVNFGNAIVATLVACALAAIWIGGVAYTRRNSDTRMNKYDRERRGF